MKKGWENEEEEEKENRIKEMRRRKRTWNRMKSLVIRSCGEWLKD